MSYGRASDGNIIRPNAKGNPVALPVVACDDCRTLADIRRASENRPAGPTSPKPPQARAARTPFPSNRQVDRTAWRSLDNRPTSFRETIRPRRRLRRFSRLPVALGRTSLPDVLRSAKGKNGARQLCPPPRIFRRGANRGSFDQRKNRKLSERNAARRGGARSWQLRFRCRRTRFSRMSCMKCCDPQRRGNP